PRLVHHGPTTDLTHRYGLLAVEDVQQAHIRMAEIPEFAEMPRAHADHGIPEPADTADDVVMQKFRLRDPRGPRFWGGLFGILTGHSAKNLNRFRRVRPLA